MYSREYYMQRCLDLARNGLGRVAPNPMVGSVIVHEGKIIGEGYHQIFGEAHAEVNAIQSVANQFLLEYSTLYVNLEPCAHHGKTPPCSDLITKHKIPTVVIGCRDSFSEVNGKGIEALKKQGTYVVEKILEKESLFLNRRFFTSINKKRPYVILKWAKSSDGFMDIDRVENQKGSFLISSEETKIISHKWRTEEQAIMVGTKTALIDNPKLTSRLVSGNQPVRVLIDKNLVVPANYNLFDDSAKTIVFNEIKSEIKRNIEYIRIDKKENNYLMAILEILHSKNILSVIIEGGAVLLNSFIESNLWDEARVITSNTKIKNGLLAPVLISQPIENYIFATDQIQIFYNS